VPAWRQHDVRDRDQGVFAVGDVRSGSVKRVASTFGVGAIAVRLVHEYLVRVGRR